MISSKNNGGCRGARLFTRGVVREGLGSPSDSDGALEDYRRAAVLGNRQAQYFLALWYAAGQNNRKNHRLAMAWFRRAAYAGEELCALVVPGMPSSPEDQIVAFKTLLRGL